MKKCSNCFQMKEFDAFYPKGKKYLQSRCKACNAEVCLGYVRRKKESMREKYNAK